MNRKQADDKPDVVEFEKINREIDLLMKRLRGFCPCCIACGMLWRGAHLLVDVAGGEETIEACHDIVDAIEHPDEISEMSETQH